jgi:hypothetical protein
MQVRKPHMKKSVVTATIAEVFVEAGFSVSVAYLPTFAIAIETDSSLFWCPLMHLTMIAWREWCAVY